MREIYVYNGDSFAGVLTEKSSAEYIFRYNDDYLEDKSQPAISVTLPKIRQIHTCDSVFPFFTNLLPEGINRHALCTRSKVDEHDLFGMLMAVRGWDFIGDVSLR
ncbi:MAG: HipA N-terminal domain-containing protein [Bacteroidales bacterium]|nr:HipA N-terminal domain-containing protein [Bacteroidales bacterium]